MTNTLDPLAGGFERLSVFYVPGDSGSGPRATVARSQTSWPKRVSGRNSCSSRRACRISSRVGVVARSPWSTGGCRRPSPPGEGRDGPSTGQPGGISVFLDFW